MSKRCTGFDGPSAVSVTTLWAASYAPSHGGAVRGTRFWGGKLCRRGRRDLPTGPGGRRRSVTGLGDVQLVAECPLADAEQLGSPRTIAAGGLERLIDGDPLEQLQVQCVESGPVGFGSRTRRLMTGSRHFVQVRAERLGLRPAGPGDLSVPRPHGQTP